MVKQEWHIVSALLLGAAAWPLYGFEAAYALAFGALFPDIDNTWKSWHRSWLTHTALVPALLAYSTVFYPALKPLAPLIPFFTFGIIAHLLLDIYSYENFKGNPLPLNPMLSNKWPSWSTLALMIFAQLPFLFYGLL